MAALAARRMAGEPLQYLEGFADFGPIRIGVDSRALIPRPETEQLWELSVIEQPSPSLAADLCTGTGALALAIKHAVPACRVIGTDLSSAALDRAAENAVLTGLAVDWRLGDLYTALPDDLVGSIDLIICNPPYVAEAEWPGLPIDVRWEPQSALKAGATGLEMIERVVEGARHWLGPGGVIACEIGETQSDAVAALLLRAGLEGRIEADLTGRPRFAVARPAIGSPS
jgi:release factor glutamine methyltransferase